MFMFVMQSENVLDVFFDVLALQFIESIDDVAFSLAKRGFFGSPNQCAARKEQSIQRLDRVNTRGIATKSRANQWARGLYYFNTCCIISLMVTLHVLSKSGRFRCNALTATFEEKILEQAYVAGDRRVLVFSYFNGQYVESGTANGERDRDEVDVTIGFFFPLPTSLTKSALPLFSVEKGYPRYEEVNKNDGSFFVQKTGAEFIYCKKMNKWVFRHEFINTALNEEREVRYLDRIIYFIRFFRI